MGFQLQQKLMTMNDLKRQFTALSSVMRVLTKRLRLESRSFRCKVVQYLSYLHIKLDDKTKGNSFEFQAYFPIRLRPCFGFICSQILQLPRLVRHIYGNQQTCDKYKYAENGTLIGRFAE